MNKCILITGAAGGVASWLRKSLAEKYQLRLTDKEPIDDLNDGESFVQADVTDFEAIRAQMDGVYGVIHLGSIPVEAAWEGIYAVNLGGTHNVFEAARKSGVQRVVFASSNHAVGFYPRDVTISEKERTRPDSRYGVSKAFGEALGSLYADKYGLKVLSIRIGNVGAAPIDRRRLSIWLSPRDLTQLVEIGLEHPELHCEVVYGMSDNARAWWDNSTATRLGYKPQDKADDYADEILARAPPLDPNSLSDRHQGGDFCVLESGGGRPQKDLEAG